MNATELQAALSHHDADPSMVLTQLKAKRQRRRRRQGIICSLTAVTLVAVGSGAWGVWSNLSSPSSGTHNSALAPGKANATIPTNSPTDGGLAEGYCFPLKDRIAKAPAKGISIITGTSTRTGQIKPDGYLFNEVTLANIKTLAGPKIDDGAKAWILVPTQPPTPEPGVVEIGPNGPLWGPDGKFFGLYTPQKVNRGPLGATLDQVPLIGDNVILLASHCWSSLSAVGLTGTPYHGPLTEIPNSGTYTRLAAKGFLAVPLNTIAGFIPK
jgi:hypothetical protein